MQSGQAYDAVGVKQFYKPGRRPRVPLSCDPCRTRKLKCNREQPCQNCTTRDEISACKYKGSKNESALGSRPQSQRVDLMQQRIDHLEALVKKLMAQQPHSPPGSTVYSQGSPSSLSTRSIAAVPPLDASPESPAGSTTVINGSQFVYKATDDWYDVLQEINKIKNVWNHTQYNQSDYDIPPDPSNTVDGSSLLFGQVKPTDLLEILAALPPKTKMDKMLSHFFDLKSFPITISPILHEPTFMREYAEHCKDPSRTNVMWLGLLFSILSITMLSYHQFHEPPEYEGISESLFHLYRMRTAQCLILGDIAKCLPYTIETLRFNATAELNRKDDNSRGLWIMTGVIIRAAINMGYHRDPSRLTSISILKAEYRRRVWFSVIGMDELSSFRVGFPRMLSAIYSDTMEPRNIHDWELSDETTALPSSRPLTESTAATYLIVKGRMSRALGRIVDFNNIPGSAPYDTVLVIDKELYEAYEGFPVHMKMGSDVRSFKAKSDVSNLQLAFMYHQGMCTLHRTFISKSRIDPRYKISLERCISSASAILGFQHVLDPAWYKFSQMRKMMTLAAMILFLELEYRRKGADPNNYSDSPDLLRALENSCAFWETAKSSCDEAARMNNVLAGMLSGFRSPVDGTPSQAIAPELILENYDFNLQFQPTTDNLTLEVDTLSVPNEMDIDWNMWDAFIEGENFGDSVFH